MHVGPCHATQCTILSTLLNHTRSVFHPHNTSLNSRHKEKDSFTSSSPKPFYYNKPTTIDNKQNKKMPPPIMHNVLKSIQYTQKLLFQFHLCFLCTTARRETTLICSERKIRITTQRELKNAQKDVEAHS